MSRALPFFHAFTGCDTTPQFFGKGKRIAWESWKSFPEVTEAFLSVMNQPFQFLKVDSTAMKLLERFTCILYDKTTPLVSVNELRQELFCKRKDDGEHTSYSGNQYFLNLSIIYNFYLHLHYILQSSLLQHSNRAVYQASIWARSPQEIQNIPLPEGFGWKNIEGSWKPVWTLLSEVARASRELIKCGCRAKPLCSRRCKCQVAGLSCTALCQCSGNCEH